MFRINIGLDQVRPAQSDAEAHMHGEESRQRPDPQPEAISVQCVHCGSITTTRLHAVVECPGCGRLCFRIVDPDAPIGEPATYRPPSPSDNSHVVDEVAVLVNRILGQSGGY